jgi:hypothetical protein
MIPLAMWGQPSLTEQRERGDPHGADPPQAAPPLRRSRASGNPGRKQQARSVTSRSGRALLSFRRQARESFELLNAQKLQRDVPHEF